MESFTPKVQELIKTEALKNNFSENFEVKVTSGSNKGDGYLSEVKAVQLREKNTQKTLNLIVKVASPSVEFRKQFPTRKTFLRETYIYETVMPEFIKFQEQHNITNCFREIPKYYGSVTKEYQEAILLENLHCHGYKIGNRKEPMNDDQLKIILTEYGKLHAISFAMRALEPKRFEKIVDGMREMVWGEQAAEPQFISLLFKDTLELVKDNSKAYNAITKLKDGIEFLFKGVELLEEKYKAISHSDCWAPNYMFKYEDTQNPEKPTKIRILDWQLSMYSIVITDISYFLLISGSKEALQNYKQYLDLYYDTLSNQLKEFGCDANEVYPEKDFENHWKANAKMGFFNVMIMLQQALTDSKGTASLDKLVENGKSLLEKRFGTEYDNKELFGKRMWDIVNFLLDNELL